MSDPGCLVTGKLPALLSSPSKETCHFCLEHFLLADGWGQAERPALRQEGTQKKQGTNSSFRAPEAVRNLETAATDAGVEGVPGWHQDPVLGVVCVSLVGGGQLKTNDYVFVW